MMEAAYDVMNPSARGFVPATELELHTRLDLIYNLHWACQY